MVYQQDSSELRTRQHQSPETLPIQDRLEDVLARMGDPDGFKQLVCLTIYNQTEHVALAEEQSVILGRSDKQTGYMPDVDLMRFNARKHGVSREHACLYLRGGRLYVMDLGSNNGTFLAGKLLTPHFAQPLQSGDVIRLGLLEILVELA